MKRPIILFFLTGLTTVTFLLTNCSPGGNSKNLTVNPGFEQDGAEAPAGWTINLPRNIVSHRLGADDSVAHSGEKSFRLAGVWAYPKRSATVKTSQPVPIDPLKDYLLSFWYRTEGITEYPESFTAQFSFDCTPRVSYAKKVYNSEQWQEYFILLDYIPTDTKTVTISFGTNVNSQGAIWIDDVAFREATSKDVKAFETWRRQPLPEPIGVATGKQFGATGFFRVEQDADRWWIIDPNGRPGWGFGVAGTRGPTPGDDIQETQTSSFISRFGTTIQSVNRELYRIFTEECGFNFLAGWSADAHAAISKERFLAGQPYLPFTRVLGLSSASPDTTVYAKDRNGTLRNKPGHEVVDPYNPLWRKMAREKAGKLIQEYRDEPWFLGWYVDNEMSFDELFRYIWADYSSREFLNGLREKYLTAEALNRAWSSDTRTFNYAAFEDILADKPEPMGWNDPAWTDFAAFERRMMKEYIDFTYDLVKELDPNHLVISNRINLGPMPDIYRTADLWGKYDIICMNIYPDNNKIGFNPGELEVMRKLHEGTGRPVIIGEWSVPAIDSKLYEFGIDPFNRPLDWSYPQVLRTQQERGEAYDACIRQLASLDFMVGAGWFITFDVDKPDRRSNRGIIDRQYELYRELTDAMKKVHDDLKKTMGLTW